VTLTQLLISIAILAFPMALYATELRGMPGRRPDIPLLLGSLAAHCIELEAFHWLILAPGIGRLLARWHAPRPEFAQEDRVSREGSLSRILLLFGPCYAVFVPLAGWAVGYRGVFAPIFELTFLLLVLVILVLIPFGLVYMIVQLIRRPRSFSRPLASVSLLLLAVPCQFSFWTAVNVGWGQLEREIGLPRLGRECVSLFESGAGQSSGWVSDELLQTAAMRRLRPTHVSVAPGRYLTIELHGASTTMAIISTEIPRTSGGSCTGPAIIRRSVLAQRHLS
jgi:hypothetical protein